MNKLVGAAKKLALDEFKRTGMPLEPHIALSHKKGKELAKQLKANTQIVEIGTYLMDCMIGQALKEERLKDHVKMSLKRTDKLLQKHRVDDSVKENIRHCVKEHHGVKKFYSLESEICCNADCYRFISIRGFSFAFRYLREIPFEDLINLLENKVNEKWKVLTLGVCKKELEPQYKIIKEFLKNLKK